jgi:hypothetical protein
MGGSCGGDDDVPEEKVTMIPAARGRRLPFLAFSLAVAAGTVLAGTAPAPAALARGTTQSSGSPSSDAASAARPARADPRLEAPEVDQSFIQDLEEAPVVHLRVGFRPESPPDLAEPRIEYRIDGAVSWRTGWDDGYEQGGTIEGTEVRISAPPGPHVVEVRVAGLLDGLPVVGMSSSPATFDSVGRVLPYTPLVEVDGTRVTVRWDVRPVLNGWPEERSVDWTLGDAPGGVAPAVGSATADIGYGSAVAFSMHYGGNADFDRYVSFSVATDNPPGSLRLTSAPVPTILGDAQVGTTLSVRTATWRPAPVELTYQWFADRVPLAGETDSTYRVDHAALGRRITVEVRGIRSGYRAETRTSGPTARARVNVIVPDRPVIIGTGKAGSLLTIRPGAWAPGGVALTYQWKRDGEAIPGATGMRYTPEDTDRGSDISVDVRGTKQLFPDAYARSASRRVH